jgi:hypothetical protein
MFQGYRVTVGKVQSSKLKAQRLKLQGFKGYRVTGLQSYRAAMNYRTGMYLKPLEP